MMKKITLLYKNNARKWLSCNRVYQSSFFLDYLREHSDKFSLIIVDYRMSPMQGCELSIKISTINPKIKMIFLTPYDEIKNNSLNLEIVKKPITNTELLQIIQQHLS